MSLNWWLPRFLAVTQKHRCGTNQITNPTSYMLPWICWMFDKPKTQVLLLLFTGNNLAFFQCSRFLYCRKTVGRRTEWVVRLMKHWIWHWRPGFVSWNQHVVRWGSLFWFNTLSYIQQQNRLFQPSRCNAPISRTFILSRPFLKSVSSSKFFELVWGDTKRKLPSWSSW